MALETPRELRSPKLVKHMATAISAEVQFSNCNKTWNQSSKISKALQIIFLKVPQINPARWIIQKPPELHSAPQITFLYRRGFHFSRLGCASRRMPPVSVQADTGFVTSGDTGSADLGPSTPSQSMHRPFFIFTLRSTRLYSSQGFLISALLFFLPSYILIA